MVRNAYSWQRRLRAFIKVYCTRLGLMPQPFCMTDQIAKSKMRCTSEIGSPTHTKPSSVPHSQLQQPPQTQAGGATAAAKEPSACRAGREGWGRGSTADASIPQISTAEAIRRSGPFYLYLSIWVSVALHYTEPACAHPDSTCAPNLRNPMPKTLKASSPEP